MAYPVFGWRRHARASSAGLDGSALAGASVASRGSCASNLLGRMTLRLENGYYVRNGFLVSTESCVYSSRFSSVCGQAPSRGVFV